MAMAAVAAGGASAFAQTLTPVTLSGWNQDVIVESTPATATATAGFDAYNNQNYYANGFNGVTTGGLPANGNFVAHNNPSATFQIAPYNASNSLLFNTVPTDTYAAVVTSGILTLNSPNAFTNLAFLSAATNNKATDVINYALNFADGSSTTGSFAGRDWYYTTATSNGYAIALSRVSRNTGIVDAGTNFRLWEDDITVPVAYQAKVLTSIAFNTTSTGYAWGLYGVSGALNGTGTGTIVWNGDKSSAWDTTTANWQGNALYADFNSVTFDDSATGTTAVVVQPAGVRPAQVLFNNNQKNYSFTGGAINASSIATFNGSGTVTFGNAVQFSGGMSLNNGTAVFSNTASLTTPSVAITSPASLIFQGSAVSPLNGGSIALTGNGSLNLSSGIFSAGAGTSFSGPLAGAGTLNLAAGVITVPSASAFNFTGAINVGTTNTSTANLVIADTGSPVGLVNGTPVTVTVAGNGPAGVDPNGTAYGNVAGALRGVDGGTVTFAGNVVIAPVGAAVSGGSGGTLTITGNVSGSGPVSYSTNGGATTILSGNNTNTGEVRLAGENFNFAPTAYLQLGSNNALGSGGIALSSAAGQAILDLKGFNQSSAYLSGGGTTTFIQNTGNGPAVLTITNGNTATGAAVFGSPINENGQPITLVKTGTGTQILTAVNTYSGGTNVAGGVLTLSNPQAAGSNGITLSGGTLRLATGAGNLTGFGTFQLNGGASVANNVLTLTSSVNNQDRSAFSTAPALIFDSAGFSASFTYTPTTGADGAAFVVQNDSRGAGALGGGGGGLGYGVGDGGTAIGNSIAAEFNLYSTARGIGFGTNGSVATQNTATGTVVVGGDPLAVTLVYNGSAQTLTETVHDNTSNGTVTYVRTGIDLNAILGGTNAYIGFTGATGGVNATQTVSNFQFSSGGLAGPININNAITTQAGTSSTINAPVVTGLNLSTVGPITVANNSTLAITSSPSTTVTRLVLSTSSLTISSTGRLDVTNNDLILPNTDIATASALARAGQANGFTGFGITSSTAAADSRHTMAVAVVSNNFNGTQLFGNGTTFDGANPNFNDTLVKYTYFGDANLDGKVDGSDYARIDNGFLTAGSTGWANGDFNYDGSIDGSDYSLIDNAYNRQGVALNSAALAASPTALVAGSPTSTVPEPTTFGTIAVAACLLGRRRK